MKQIIKTPKFVVYDDVLTREECLQLWKYVQDEHYTSPLASGEWIKVWRLGDQSPLGTNVYYQSQAPFNTPLDLMVKPAVEVAKLHPEIVAGFEDISLRSYLYPRGSKLSWHDDRTEFSGALTYYIHPRWGSTWGGELMVAEVPPITQVFSSPPDPAHLSHEWEDHYLSVFGLGQWITPKPNRLVLMAPGVYHGINRVDDDAGDHVRCSIVGFYKREKRTP
jgi:hypothetical protein